jgi:Ribonuclease G/E
MELIFGTYQQWQIALVQDGHQTVAALFDSVDKPNLQGAIATGRVTSVHGHFARVALPDDEEGYLESKSLPSVGNMALVRITTYVQPPKDWPLKLVDGDPAGSVQWHDAATSIMDHACTQYSIPATAMRQDDDAVVDYLQRHQGREELQGGASIVVESTSALTTIDLNAGHLRGMANWIAVFGVAVADAIRQYNIGGSIVIDAQFLGMGARKGLAEKIERELERDPLHPRVLGCTRMGLIEITRPRLGPSRLQVRV